METDMNIKIENNEEIDEQGMPWLVFKLKQQHFAIDSSTVETIFLINQPIVEVPNCPDCIKGIINLRGDIVPILDLRVVLGMETSAAEQKAFFEMLEQRKEDHKRWVDVLERSLHDGSDFPLAKDHHKCALGQWYDSFETDNQTVAFHLRKIEEPHRKLHESAEKLISEVEKCTEEDKQNSCIEKYLETTAFEYREKIIGLLDEVKQIFEESYHQMCVVIRNNKELVGLMVDEVSAVESLSFMVNEQALNNFYNSSLIVNVAKSANINSQILVLDSEAIFNPDWI